MDYFDWLDIIYPTYWPLWIKVSLVVSAAWLLAWPIIDWLCVQ